MSAAVSDAASVAELAELAGALKSAVERLVAVTRSLVGVMMADPTRGLANASVYLDLVSRTVFAWLWLRQAVVASRAIAAGSAGSDALFYAGKVQAARFYFGFELPKNGADAELLLRNDSAALDMKDEWF